MKLKFQTKYLVSLKRSNKNYLKIILASSDLQAYQFAKTKFKGFKIEKIDLYSSNIYFSL